MRAKKLTVGLFALQFALPCAVVGGDSEDSTNKSEARRVPELHAKCWFNAQPVRLHESPRLILLEFWSVRSRESRELVEPLSKLYEAFDKGALLIVALTQDECDETQAYLRREKIRYKVGAESRSRKDYGFEELPAVVLIDPEKRRILEQWSGRDVKLETIARAIENVIGPPQWAAASAGTVTREEAAWMWETGRQFHNLLSQTTSRILAQPGPIGPEAIAPLVRLYESNLPEDPSADPEEMEPETRMKSYARGAVLGPDQDVGYGKLIASGRLSEAGRAYIRNHALEMLETDPSPGVRIDAANDLRRFIAEPGDAALLEKLRRLHDAETEPLVRASMEQALKELANSRAKEQARRAPPDAGQLARMLNLSDDPASSPWAEAHAYRQTLSRKTDEQMIGDYDAFRSAPDADEVARQNTDLKRYVALDEIGNRIREGRIADLSGIKQHLERVLVEETDRSIRWNVVGDLNQIAENGGRALRAEIMNFLEMRLAKEPDAFVRARIATHLQELKDR